MNLRRHWDDTVRIELGKSVPRRCEVTQYTIREKLEDPHCRHSLVAPHACSIPHLCKESKSLLQKPSTPDPFADDVRPNQTRLC